MDVGDISGAWVKVEFQPLPCVWCGGRLYWFQPSSTGMAGYRKEFEMRTLTLCCCLFFACLLLFAEETPPARASGSSGRASKLIARAR